MPGGKTLNKIESAWYKQVGGNLVFVGSNTALAPANGKYKTQTTQVDLKDNNQNLLSYTVIVTVWIDAPNPTDPPIPPPTPGIQQNYKP